jgi:hypothetical protein
MDARFKFKVAVVCTTLAAVPAIAATGASAATPPNGQYLPPSTAPQTVTRTVTAPPSECRAIARKHPRLAGKPCLNRITVHTGPLSAKARHRLQHRHGTAVSSAYAWQYWSASARACSIYGCWAWHAKLAAAYHYNGYSVWKDWVDCSDRGGVGYTVDPTWCDVWNNGGYGWGYASFGENFTVYTGFKGFPLSFGYWHRLNVTPNGGLWYTHA